MLNERNVQTEVQYKDLVHVLSKLHTNSCGHRFDSAEELNQSHGPPESLLPSLVQRQSLLLKYGPQITAWNGIAITEAVHQQGDLSTIDLMFRGPIDQVWIILELLVDAAPDEFAHVLNTERLAPVR